MSSGQTKPRTRSGTLHALRVTGMWTSAPCNRDVDLRLGRRVREVFWVAQFVVWFSRKEEKVEEEEKEQERAAGGRAGGRRGGWFDSVFFLYLLCLLRCCLLACLPACIINTWGRGSSRNLELCGVQKIDFVLLTLMRIWEYKIN